MNNILLRNVWLEQINKMLPGEPESRRINLTNFLIGVYLSANIQLKKIARHVPSLAKATSTVVRLSRFLENEGVDVDAYYGPEAKKILEAIASAGQEIRLVIDGTVIGNNFQLLIVAVAYRRRAIPIAWIWIPHKKGHSTDKQQKELLEKVKRLVPEGAKVSLVGDSEFGRVTLIEKLEEWGWRYALRVSSRELYRDIEGKWRRIKSAARKGESIDLGEIVFTKRKRCRTRLIAHWEKGQKEPWLIVTNMESKREAIQSYKRRMWIEEMFGDMKGNGFNLEKTRLQEEEKLNRLTMVVCLLYVWLDLLFLIVLLEHLNNLPMCVCFQYPNFIDFKSNITISPFA